jgi:flagella basal body P-ring formation protein FlgA
MSKNITGNILQIAKQFIVFILIFITSLVIFSIVSAALEKAHAKGIDYIKVPSLVLVNTNNLFLGDIAEIHIEDKNIKYFASQVNLGRAPVPGETRYLRGEYVKNLLMNKLNSSIKLIVPKKVKVVSRVKYLSSEDVKHELLLFLRNTSVWKKRLMSGSKLVLSRRFSMRPIAIPDRKVKLGFKVPDTDDLLGPTNIGLQVFDGEKIIKKMWFRANIAFSGNIIVAKEKLLPGTIITKDMVAFKKITVENAPAKFFTVISEVVQKRVKTYIRPGFAITNVMIENPPMVNFGDVVELIANSGAIEIRARGKAMQKGYMGSLIRVQNLRSKKFIAAKVTGDKEVSVIF